MTDWPVKTLGDICRIEMGRTPSRGDSKGWDKALKTANHWASIADLTACNGRVLTSTKERISDFAAKTTKVVPAGTLMMSFKLSIGKLAFAGCDLYTNEAIAAFHLNEKSNVDSDFLYWALSVVDWSALTKGSEKVKGATMNKAKLNLLEIPVPPLEEQKRIVELLDAATARVTELTACYAQARARANDLFVSAVRGALESNPDWPVKVLGDVCELSLGKMLDSKQKTGLHPTPYLRNVNVRWGSIDTRDMSSMDIRPEEMDRVTASPGDVIVCEGGEPGRCAVWKGPGRVAIQKALHRVRPKNGIDGDYVALFLAFLAETGELKFFFTGTTIKHIPKEKLHLIPIPVPPLEEQKRIVARLDALRSKTSAMSSAYGEKQTATNNLRQSILEAAFVGDL